MPITLDKPAISTLKTYKIITDFEYAYFGLRLLKDPANSTQLINTDQFEMDWGVNNTSLLRYLQSLETKKVLKVTPTSLTVNWGQLESTTISRDEVLAMKKDGLINQTTYVYYALLLNKGAGLSQPVNPDSFSVAPWSITPSTLLQELTNISQKTNDDGSKVITLDLTNISVIWLM